MGISNRKKQNTEKVIQTFYTFFHSKRPFYREKIRKYKINRRAYVQFFFC